MSLWPTYPHSGDMLDDEGHTLGHILLPQGYVNPPLEVGTPAWWLRRLIGKLVKSSNYFERHQRFYDGDQPLAFASDKWLQAYGSRFNIPSNFMPLVVGAEQERLIVDGFRFGTTADSDKTVW